MLVVDAGVLAVVGAGAGTVDDGIIEVVCTPPYFLCNRRYMAITATIIRITVAATATDLFICVPSF